MFGIGFQEMIIILVVVLIIFGPKRLPDLAKSLGKGLMEFRKASDEVRKGIEEAAREEEKPPAPAKEADAEEGTSSPETPPAGEDAETARPADADAETPRSAGKDAEKARD